MNSFLGVFVALFLLAVVPSTIASSYPTGAFRLNERGLLSSSRSSTQSQNNDKSFSSELVLNSFYPGRAGGSFLAPTEFGFGSLITNLDWLDGATFFAFGVFEDFNDTLTMYLGEYDATTESIKQSLGSASIDVFVPVYVSNSRTMNPTALEFVFPARINLNRTKEYVLYFNNTVGQSELRFLRDTVLAPSLLYVNGLFQNKVSTYGPRYGLYQKLISSSLANFETSNIFFEDEKAYLDFPSLPPAGTQYKLLPYSVGSLSLRFWNAKSTDEPLRTISVYMKMISPTSPSQAPITLTAEIQGDLVYSCSATATLSEDADAFTRFTFTCGTEGDVILAGSKYTFLINLEPLASYGGNSGGIAFQTGTLLYNTPFISHWTDNRNVNANSQDVILRFDLDVDLCTGHGTKRGCDCVCARDWVNGFWAGDNCDECLTNFYGDNCDIFCKASKTCNNRGTCTSFGNCTCNEGYGGTFCDISSLLDPSF